MESLTVYICFEQLSDAVWDCVIEWDAFAKGTVGKQLVNALDSVGANLVEGDGRSTTADALHFFIIARGSARESLHFLRRARMRRLIPVGTAEIFMREISEGTRLINGLIRYRRARGWKRNEIREIRAPYKAAQDEKLESELATFLADRSTTDLKSQSAGARPNSNSQSNNPKLKTQNPKPET